jgi:hypothetical protein
MALQNEQMGCSAGALTVAPLLEPFFTHLLPRFLLTGIVH